MLPRWMLALTCATLATSLTLAQNGPQIFSVSPNGANPGSTVELTVSGANLKDAETLLFAHAGVRSERVSSQASEKEKASGGGKGKVAANVDSTATFKVTFPPDMPTGLVDVRVVTRSGLSNPRGFAISRLAEVVEKEPNNDLPEALAVGVETAVSGVISAPTDVDYVKFSGKAGQKLVIACQTATIDSRLPVDLTVANAQGVVLASNRAYRGTEAIIPFTCPADGDYFIRVASFAFVTGGADHFYRLLLTARPWVDTVFPPLWLQPGQTLTVYGYNLPNATADPAVSPSDGRPAEAIRLTSNSPPPIPPTDLRSDLPLSPPSAFLDGAPAPIPLDLPVPPPILLFPQANVVFDAPDNDTSDKAQPITLPCDVVGRIEKRNDRDWYSFTAKKGEPIIIELMADRLGSPVDAYWLLLTDQGRVVVEHDDPAESLSPNQFYTRSEDPARYRFVPNQTGTYRLMVSTRENAIQSGPRDQYVLRLTPEKPDFRLAVMPYLPNFPEGVALPRGGSYPLTVYLDRRDGFSGAVSLEVEGLPPGVTCPPQVIGPLQSKGYLVLTASPEAAEWAGVVRVVGRAEVGGERVERVARAFTVTWGIPDNQGRPPQVPLLTRQDRSPGLTLAVRGQSLFTLTFKVPEVVKAPAGEKVEIPLSLVRTGDFKDAVQIQALTPVAGAARGGGGGNRPDQPLATIEAGKTEGKISYEVPGGLVPGRYSVAFRAVVPDPTKSNQPRPPKAAYATPPITLEVVPPPPKDPKKK